MKSSERWLLAGILACLLATRAWFLVGSVEEIAVNDELTSGLLYQSLSGMRVLPLSSLWAPTVGGDLLYQLLSMPLYALLGDSILSIKAFAFLISGFGLLLLLTMGRAWGGRDQALLAAVFFILAPPAWMGLSMVGTGDHFLTGLMALLSAHLLVSLGSQQEPRPVGLLVIGFVIGFSLYVNYMFVIAIPGLCLLFLLLSLNRGRRAWTRTLPLGLVGALLGLLPLLLTVAIRGFGATTRVYQRDASEQFSVEPLRVLGRMGQLLVRESADALYFPQGISGLIGARLLQVLVLLAVVLTIVQLGRQFKAVVGSKSSGSSLEDSRRASWALDLFLLTLLAAFLLAWGFSRFEFEPRRLFGYRYLAVLYPALCLLVARRLVELPRLPRALLSLGWWLPCLVALLLTSAPHSAARILDYPGITWTNAANRAVELWREDLGGALSTRVTRLPEPQRSAFLFGLGAQVGVRWPLDRMGLVNKVPPPDGELLHVQRGLLSVLARGGPMGMRPARERLRLIERVVPREAEPLASMLFEGAAANWPGTPDTMAALLQARGSRDWIRELEAELFGASLAERSPVDELELLFVSLDPELRGRAWYGAGLRIASRKKLPLALDLSRMISDTTMRERFLEGAARSLREAPLLVAEPVASCVRLAEQIPAQDAEPFFREAGRAAAGWNDRSTARLARSLAALPPAAREPFCEGMGIEIALNSKTLTDMLRWRLPWDRHAGSGCEESFLRGLSSTLQRTWGLAPQSLVFYERRLGLPRSGP